jgi:hypothetical protein
MALNFSLVISMAMFYYFSKAKQVMGLNSRLKVDVITHMPKMCREEENLLLHALQERTRYHPVLL